MTVRPFALLLFMTFFCFSQEVLSQARPEPKDTIIYRVETDDGNVYYGTIINQAPGYVLLSTENLGVINIQLEHLVKMEQVNSSKPKKKKPETSNAHETIYHIAPNGYGLKKGEGYIQNYYIFLNQVNFGITDYFSLGGGIVPVSVLWIAPKFSIPVAKNKLNLGVGSVNGIVLGEGITFGAIYGNLTIGGRERNFSIGAGSGYDSGDFGSLALSISGSYKIGERAYLITENYKFGGISTGTVGGRYSWPNISLDYGVVYVVDFDLAIVFPLVGVKIPFNVNKND